MDCSRFEAGDLMEGVVDIWLSKFVFPKLVSGREVTLDWKLHSKFYNHIILYLRLTTLDTFIKFCPELDL